jgi:hypothetical protein
VGKGNWIDPRTLEGRADARPRLTVPNAAAGLFLTGYEIHTSVQSPRLRQLGFIVTNPASDPEIALYLAIAAEDPDSAHSRYNALIRRLVSFERAAGCAA